MTWSNAGFVRASKIRMSIMKLLKKSAMTPLEMAKYLHLKPEAVSRALRELSERNLVTCLNPQLRKGRMYTLSKAGSEILQVLRNRAPQ